MALAAIDTVSQEAFAALLARMAALESEVRRLRECLDERQVDRAEIEAVVAEVAGFWYGCSPARQAQYLEGVIDERLAVPPGFERQVEFLRAHSPFKSARRLADAIRAERRRSAVAFGQVGQQTVQPLRRPDNLPVERKPAGAKP